MKRRLLHLNVLALAIGVVAMLLLGTRGAGAGAVEPVSDIVFMVDETNSMSPHVADVQAHLGSMATQLDAALDVQLGLVGFGATSVHGGVRFSSQPHIHQSLTADVSAFQTALGALIANGPVELGFAATVLATDDAMGFRPGANVCTVMITDDDAAILVTQAPETQADAIAALTNRDAVFLGLVNPFAGDTLDQYGPNPGSLADATGGQVLNFFDFRVDPRPALDAIIAACGGNGTDRSISLSPPAAQNTVGDDHTLTATVLDGAAPLAGVEVAFSVVSGPNTGEASDPGAGECASNDDCTTDANGEVSFTYSGAGGVGTDGITACFTDPVQGEVCSEPVTKEWVAPPTAVVEIDVRPGSNPNQINPRSRGVVPVAILTSAAFDATQVDYTTVCFGDADEPSERACTEADGRAHHADVDGDGDTDLLLHYRTQETGIASGDTQACFTAATFGGESIEGCDSVRVR